MWLIIPECQICTRPKKIVKLYTTQLKIINKKPLYYRFIAIETASLRKVFRGYKRVDHQRPSFPELDENPFLQDRLLYPLVSVEIHYSHAPELMSELSKKEYSWVKPQRLFQQAKIAEKYFACLVFCPTRRCYEQPWPKPGCPVN